MSRIVNTFVCAADHLKEITLTTMILVGAIVFVPGFNNSVMKVTAWNKQHPNNCGWTLPTSCIDFNGTVTSVRDYTIECDSLFNRATCPRETLGIEITPEGYNLTLTINCHFYQKGDSVTVTRQLNYYPTTNETAVGWSVKGGPCQ